MRGRPIRHLYVHVPFCASKCEYCAFFSEAAQGELVNRYVRALVRELESVARDLVPETVFFGGGTPTLLNCRQWEEILAAMRRFGLDRPAEWTVECNPATLSPDKARLLREGGVNRISMGVQSLDRDLLERLGRVHSREMAFRSYDILRQAGFDAVNLDLMFAIPGQTQAVWQRTLAEAIAMQSEHLSSYEVIYEEDTPLFAQLQAGACEIDEDLACAMYDTLVDTAETHGLEQYEIANFARGGQSSLFTLDPATSNPASAPLVASRVPALACRHNIAYWRGRSFHGLGPSASSLVDGVRTRQLANTQLYCEQIERGRRPVETRDELPPLARAGEIAGFGLRMVVGWGFEEFRMATGYDLRDEWGEDLRWLAEQRLGEFTGEGFRLTRHGLRFADLAAERLLRP
ncbi:MAG: coproporphyrinogen III oxidase family protein [Verrucomicrobiales bacterium]|nr:coproporphyrinogen III oxidase family protein [Verrucomicrobiales bacterium]